MDKKVKWGVIGSGGIARRRTIPEGLMKAGNAKLALVYDIDPKINKAVAEEFGVTAAESIDELLRSDIDAVYIASPVILHKEQVSLCAKAKKHVLCEKPLGLTADEAESIVKICHKEGVRLGTGLMMRFLEQHKAALELVRTDKLGLLVYGRAQLSCWYPPIKGAWRQDPATGGGGSLMDLGSHCIDLLEMFFGKVKRVSCFTGHHVHDYQSEDSAVVLLTFESGAMVTVDAFFCIPDNSSKNILEIYGTKGSILARGTIGQGSSGEMTAYLEDSDTGYDAAQQRAQLDGMVISPEPVNTYMAEIKEFSGAILENREPANSGMIGLANQLILEACYESAKTRKVIEVNY